MSFHLASQAESFGCLSVDLRKEGTLQDHIAQLLPQTGGIIDAAVDCVGFEARGTGAKSKGEVRARRLRHCFARMLGVVALLRL